MLCNPSIVDWGVIRDDHNGIHSTEQPLRERRGFKSKMVFSERGKDRDIGVMIKNGRPLLSENVHDGESRGFSGVIHVFLISHTENQDVGSFNALPSLIEGIHDFGYDIIGNGDIDFPCQLDKACGKIVLFCFPGKIEGIDGNAMASHAGPWVKGRIAKGFCAGCCDHFPDINSHPVSEHL